MTHASSDTWVLIPSYNDRPAVTACLESLYDSSVGGFTQLLVDDASTDDTAEYVKRRFPGCRVRVNANNLGFAGCCNKGLGVALDEGAKFVLLLNQDTLLERDTLARLIGFLEARPEAGVVGPKTYSFDRMPDGSPKLLYAGSWQRPLLPLRQHIPGIERSEVTPAVDPVQVDYVWGHGMLIRTEALRRTGLFDTDYPMYYEDLDLCRRMRSAGYEVWCDPRAVMWHDQPDGARSTRSDYWRWACKVRSATVFYRKHVGGWRAPLMANLTHLADVAQLARSGRLRAARDLATAATRHLLGLRDHLRGTAA